jgi:hypothetical protein
MTSTKVVTVTPRSRIGGWALALALAVVSASVAKADTNFDSLTSTTLTYFATVAGIAVTITLFFIGRRLLKKGAGG